MAKTLRFEYLGDKEYSKTFHGLGLKQYDILQKDMSFQNLNVSRRELLSDDKSVNIIVTTIFDSSVVSITTIPELVTISEKKTYKVTTYKANIMFDGCLIQKGYDPPAELFGEINLTQTKTTDDQESIAQIGSVMSQTDEERMYFYTRSDLQKDQDDWRYGNAYSYIDWRSEPDKSGDINIINYSGPLARYGNAGLSQAIRDVSTSDASMPLFASDYLNINGIVYPITHNEKITFEDGNLNAYEIIDGYVEDTPVPPGTEFSLESYHLGACLRRIDGVTRVFFVIMNYYKATAILDTNVYPGFNDKYDPKMNFEARVMVAEFDPATGLSNIRKAFDIPYAIDLYDGQLKDSITTLQSNMCYYKLNRTIGSQAARGAEIGFCYFSQDGTKFVQQIMSTRRWREVEIKYDYDSEGKIFFTPEISYIDAKLSETGTINRVPYAEYIVKRDTNSNDELTYNHAIALAFDYKKNVLTGFYVERYNMEDVSDVSKPHSVRSFFLSDESTAKSTAIVVHQSGTDPYFSYSFNFSLDAELTSNERFPEALNIDYTEDPETPGVFYEHSVNAYSSLASTGIGIYTQNRPNGAMLTMGGSGYLYVDIRDEAVVARISYKNDGNIIFGMVAMSHGEVIKKNFYYCLDGAGVFGSDQAKPTDMPTLYENPLYTDQFSSFGLGNNISVTSYALNGFMAPQSVFPLAAISLGGGFFLGNVFGQGFYNYAWSTLGNDEYYIYQTWFFNDEPNLSSKAKERYSLGMFPKELKESFDNKQKEYLKDDEAVFDDMHIMYRRMMLSSLNIIEDEIEY